MTVYVLRYSYRTFTDKEASRVIGVFSSFEKARDTMLQCSAPASDKFFTKGRPEWDDEICWEREDSIHYAYSYTHGATPDIYNNWEISKHEVE